MSGTGDERARRKRDLEARLDRAVLDKELELIAQGIDPAEGARLAVEYGQSKLELVAAQSLEVLRSDLWDRIDRRDGANSEYRTELVRHWGEALDRYELALDCSRLVGARLWRHADEEDLGQQRLDLQSALAGTWARSARTASEVSVLLRAGFPRGAAARARTLHELAVTAMILGNCGGQEDHEDLGSRYLAYGAIKVWMDAEEYQRHAARLGTEPLSADDLARWRKEYDEATGKYPGLDRRNGWAAGLPGYRRGTFQELELMAGLDHQRPSYSLYSHEVHSNAKGDHLNMVSTPEGPAYHVGLRMDGLAQPAQSALISLHQVVSAWGVTLDLTVSDVVLLKAGRAFVDEAREALADAEKSLG